MITLILTSRVKDNPDSDVDNLLTSLKNCGGNATNCEVLIKYDNDDDQQLDENYFSSANLALNNLWRFVEEIDGHSQKSIISKVIPQLPLKDAHTLLDAVGGSDYGLDTKVRFVCDYCNHNEIMELPITADFFTEK